MTTDRERALAELDAGGVVAAATETLFGLLADATQREAIDRVVALKPREPRGIPLILPSRESWLTLSRAIPELASALADAFWPGPLTLALPASPEIDARLVHDGTIAVRLPAPSPAAELARALGRPLTATSANPSGAPAAARAEDVARSFAAAIASGRLFLLDEPAPGGPPSTVVIVRGDSYEIAREGAVAREAIERVAAAVGKRRA